MEYLVLFVITMLAVIQANLHRYNIGELLNPPYSIVKLIISALILPFLVLSNLGVLLIIGWSFFEKSILLSLGAVGLGFVISGTLWGTFYQALLKDERAYHAFNVLFIVVRPLMQIICGSGVLYLARNYWIS